MTAEKRAIIKKFIETWRNRGDEKQDKDTFWLSILRNIYDVDDPSNYIEFEKPVQLSHQSYIDAYISTTKVLIEQKSAGVDLRKGQLQSDGSMLSPFQQARRYAGYLPHELNPRWIVVCNFNEFQIHDMNRPNDDPQIVKLEDLEKEYHRMNFLVDTGDENTKRELQVSIDAGRIVGELYDALLKQYNNPEDPETLKHLNMLCVRLVFCLYAEDAGVFGHHGMFHDYLKNYAVKDVRRALLDLFEILDTPEKDRDPYLDEDLLAFPYVNGGLFSDRSVIVPRLDEHIVDLILQRASADFDWSAISPTIFGAVFESTLNPETRRAGGMHYTSIENIHKVIDPLFLDDLRQELKDIQEVTVTNTRKQQLRRFQDKLASLTFLDPACGSGNFLTETYLSLRRMENDVLRSLSDQISLFGDSKNPIKVSINQFYGIEINDFAVTVARTALWIAESQMLKQTEDIIHTQIDFLPLKSYVNITEANALRIDWEDVVPKDKLDYIMGNPPFVGQSVRTKEQSDDMTTIWGKGEAETKLDYVICWYKKSLDFIKSSSSSITVGFVSTNSICQGESVPTFWKKMIDSGAIIQFAYKPFIWDSEANDKAAVHCVIVGFSIFNNHSKKKLYYDNWTDSVDHINPYLLNAPDVWITNRINKPKNGLPKMTTGSPPTDDGALTLSLNEKEELEKRYPILKKYIRPFIGAREFLHDKVGTFSRYCLWFQDGNPSDYANIPDIIERMNRVKKLRTNSTAKRIQKMADFPYLFCQNRQPQSTYLVFPRHSSQKRKYIPIGFVTPNVIAGDACSIIPNITLYEFGILTSNIHNAWAHVVCGRIKSDFRYSPAVYNNFPWPEPTNTQRAKIEETAQAILDARGLYTNSCLADLYKESFMPPELRKAHQNNDRAVMQAYGFDVKTMTESECVAELMKMYQALTENT